MSRAKSIADQLRTAIAQAERRGVTRYKIAKDAGVSYAALMRFCEGKTSTLRLDIAENVARAVGRRLRLDKA